jgi:hypothetical protein
MNEHDKTNLEFLLSAGPETISDWYGKTSQDDHDYAMELLAAYAKELAELSGNLIIEAELEVSQMAEAKSALMKFML